MLIIIPFFTDLLLLLRVVAVYPPRRLRAIPLMAVYAPILLLNVGRFVNIVIFCVQWIGRFAAAWRDGASNDAIYQSAQAGWSGPFAKIEWFLMLLDTS